MASGTTGRNSVGYDDVANRLIYGTHTDNNYTIRSISASLGTTATVTGSSTVINNNIRATFGTLWPGGATNTTFDMTGGGTFSNGRYYFIPDNSQTPGSPNVFLSVAISSTGVFSSPQSVALTQNLGDFGDITIAGQTMYFVSSIGFGTVNLTTGLVSVLNSSLTGGQLAFDSDGKLWNNRTDNNQLAQINPLTGTIIGTPLTLTAAAGGTLPAVFSDFAGPSFANNIPEPSVALFMLVSAVGLLRRKRL